MQRYLQDMQFSCMTGRALSGMCQARLPSRGLCAEAHALLDFPRIASGLSFGPRAHYSFDELRQERRIVKRRMNGRRSRPCRLREREEHVARIPGCWRPAPSTPELSCPAALSFSLP